MQLKKISFTTKSQTPTSNQDVKELSFATPAL